MLAVRLRSWIRIGRSRRGRRASIRRLPLTGSLPATVFCPGSGCSGSMGALILILVTHDGSLCGPALNGFASVFSGLSLAISLLFRSGIRASRIRIYISYETYSIELEPALASILISSKFVQLFISLFKTHHAAMRGFRLMTRE
jgi:hypothetical protein